MVLLSVPQKILMPVTFFRFTPGILERSRRNSRVSPGGQMDQAEGHGVVTFVSVLPLFVHQTQDAIAEVAGVWVMRYQPQFTETAPVGNLRLEIHSVATLGKMEFQRITAFGGKIRAARQGVASVGAPLFQVSLGLKSQCPGSGRHCWKTLAMPQACPAGFFPTEPPCRCSCRPEPKTRPSSKELWLGSISCSFSC